MLPAIEFSIAITPPSLSFLLAAIFTTSLKVAQGITSTFFPKNAGSYLVKTAFITLYAMPPPTPGEGSIRTASLFELLYL